jgi:hypothetical protein
VRAYRTKDVAVTISELPTRRKDDSEPETIDADPDSAQEAGTTKPRRRWFGRTKTDGSPSFAAEVSEDLERLTQGLYDFRSRLSQPSPNQSRLRAQISVATRELEVVAGDKTTRRRPWAKAAAGLLADARTALEAGQIVDGWQLVRAAERHMIEGRGVERLQDGLAVTRQRLKELAPGAPPTVRSSKDVDVMRGAALRAKGMLDSYLDEFDRLVYQKARMLGHGAILLTTMLILMGAAVLFDLPVDVDGTVLSGISTYVTIVGLGIAGAIVSRAIAGESNEGHAVQAALNPILVHVLRIALGGASALVVLVFLQSGIQGLISAVGFTAYPFAVAAGFSERFVDRVFARTERSCAEMAARTAGLEPA